MTENISNVMEQYHTITGITLSVAILQLQELLPPRAYTAVPGGADFTDIGPEYLTQKATEIFGLCGIGWAYDYDQDKLDLGDREYKTSSGKDRKEKVATINKLTMRYRYVMPDGLLVWSEPVVASGYSSNENLGYAVRGAITNGLGSAFAKLCWQLPVWLGDVSHKNAEKLWAQKHPESKSAGQKSAQASKPAAPAKATAPAPTQAAAPVEQRTAEQLKKEDEIIDGYLEQHKAEHPAPPAPVEPTTMPSQSTVDQADALVIPEGVGVPLAGKTLGEAKKDAVLGVAIIKFLAGKAPNAAQVFFQPRTLDQERLQKGALALYNAMGLANGNGKKK